MPSKGKDKSRKYYDYDVKEEVPFYYYHPIVGLIYRTVKMKITYRKWLS